jgi:hypothetical protein
MVCLGTAFGISVRQISVITGINERTIWHELKRREIKIRDKFSKITDEELDGIIKKIQEENCNLGKQIQHQKFI